MLEAQGMDALASLIALLNKRCHSGNVVSNLRFSMAPRGLVILQVMTLCLIGTSHPTGSAPAEYQFIINGPIPLVPSALQLRFQRTAAD